MEAKDLAKMFREVGPNQTLGSALKDIADKLDPQDTTSLEMAKHDWSIALRYHCIVAFQQCRKCGAVRLQSIRDYEVDNFKWTLVLKGINDDCA